MPGNSVGQHDVRSWIRTARALGLGSLPRRSSQTASTLQLPLGAKFVVALKCAANRLLSSQTLTRSAERSLFEYHAGQRGVE
jgi:hypothetical protein